MRNNIVPYNNYKGEIILGGNGLPNRYGYSEGYKMVKSYLDLHPNVTPEEWTALRVGFSSITIFNNSGAFI